MHSTFPGSAEQEIIQRQRWERGTGAARGHFFGKIIKFTGQGRFDLTLAALDLLIPPVVTLIIGLAGFTGGMLVYGLISGYWAPFSIAFFCALMVGSAVLLGALTYNAQAEQKLTLREAIAFLAVKFRVLSAGKANQWVRTGRDNEPSTPAP